MTRYINPKHHSTYTQVPDWLMSRKELSPGAKLCYARLARWYGASEDSPHAASVSLTTLGEELAVTERQVTRYTTELLAVKLIESRRRGLGRSNVYVFPDHEWRDDTAPNLSDKDTTDVSDQTGHIRPIRTRRIGPTKIQSRRYNPVDTISTPPTPLPPPKQPEKPKHDPPPWQRDPLWLDWRERFGSELTKARWEDLSEWKQRVALRGNADWWDRALTETEHGVSDRRGAVPYLCKVLTSWCTTGFPSQRSVFGAAEGIGYVPPAGLFLGTPDVDVEPTLTRAEIDAIQNRATLAVMNQPFRL